MDSMRPPANAIDQAYLCAKVEQADYDGSGGVVLPAGLLGELLDRLDSEVPTNVTVPAQHYVGLLRTIVHRAMQGGELAIPVSVKDLHTLATLAEIATTACQEPGTQVMDNVVPFPLQDPTPPYLHPEAEPA